MGEGYTKLFSDIVDSSIWSEEPDILKVWIALLALSDCEGFVRGSPNWLAYRVKLSPERCAVALNKFESPDPQSRTSANEGRRIKQVERGWLILNYTFFRNERAKVNPLTGEKNEGSVYYAAEPDGNEIKIGFSANPWARVKELTVARPQLRIVATETGTYQTERARHEQFAHLRKDGEWFEYTNEIREFIGKLPKKKDTTTRATPSLRSATTASASASASVQGTERKKERSVEKPESTEHDAFIQGWSEDFKAAFGVAYQFGGGRDGKAVKSLLGMSILRIDLLEIAKKAWPRDSFYCKQSITIHGFADNFNYIQNEISKPEKKPAYRSTITGNY